MSEFAPPSESDDANVAGEGPVEGGLLDQVLSEFRAWWTAETAQASAILAGETPPPTVDLATLVGQFTALRQEVNLQTRAVRTQQEQNGQALTQLGQALEALESRAEQDADAANVSNAELLRPLLKTLVEAHDALTLAQRGVARLQAALPDIVADVSLNELEPPESLPPPPAEAPRSFWARLFGGAAADRVDLAEWGRAIQQATIEHTLTAARRSLEDQETRRRSALAQAQSTVASILAGYAMSTQRLERALSQSGLETIPCAGQPFDPELMEVVEIVNEPGRFTTEVIDEVRRGYLWDGSVFRCAQVRVAKGVTT